MKTRVFIVHYEQTLSEDSDASGWSEHREISVRLTSDALTSGWLQRFSRNPIDYTEDSHRVKGESRRPGRRWGEAAPHRERNRLPAS